MSEIQILKFYTNENGFAPELLDVAKLFFSHTEFLTVNESTIADIVVKSETKNCVYSCFASYNDVNFDNKIILNILWTKLEEKRYKKRCIKSALYECLKKVFNKQPPWGSLTGIRPVKLAYEIAENEDADFRAVFAEKFDVSPSKITLVEQIINSQKNLRTIDDTFIDVYVGIPFCVSRCSYCSFTSGVISKLIKHVQPYVNNLITEIKTTLSFLSEYGYKIRNVYFGGGTPTSLSASDLDLILSCFDFPVTEFTVEAGRPDTIDDEKLSVLANHGVNRISVNPQSFNQVTLDKIGRNHSVKEIYEKFFLARKYDFIVNMDLIAGLPDENEQMFRYSVDEAVSLCPENITIHTLALKRGSLLKEQENLTANSEEDVIKMVEYAREKLSSNGYEPYYLYRQKYVSSNLENVGYCKKGTQCRYNIDIMEETTSIAACGCNAISKRVFSAQNRIERQANPKDVITYNNDLPLYLARKKDLFKK
ncbi:MAG: coproporphyrinogen dehydrogenase HemZ [Clostridia bacterium]|nr:coproporphyrinogen dehydrogenase HemZ [Clostridia bacterium]